MNYQISRIGNYLKVRNIDNQEDFYGAVEEVFIDRSNVGKETYKIFSVKDLQDGTLLEIGKLYKEDNSLYTASTFEDFYTNLKESITVVGGLTDAELRATPLPVSPRANTTGTNGTTPYKLISTASTNANVVKASGGNLYSIVAIGLTSTVRYLKIYSKATAPTVGTDVPLMTIPIPANTQGAGVAIPFAIGVNFPLGIGIAITSGSADNNTGAVGAGDVIVNLTYA